MEYIIISCPHCNDQIQIYLKEIKCAIYRHGVYKSNYKQIDSHLNEENCNNLIENDLIYGCGKPYQLIKVINEWKVISCEYK